MNCIPAFEYESPTLGTIRIDLELPAQGDPKKKVRRTNGKETRSNGGRSQYQFNYEDITYTLDLVFLSETLKDELELMFDEYAKFGNTFKYFPDSDEVDFINVIWAGSRKVFDAKRVIREGSGFIWDLKMPLREEI